MAGLAPCAGSRPGSARSGALRAGALSSRRASHRFPTGRHTAALSPSARPLLLLPLGAQSLAGAGLGEAR